MNQKKFKEILFVIMIICMNSALADAEQLVPGQVIKSPYEDGTAATAVSDDSALMNMEYINQGEASEDVDNVVQNGESDAWTQNYKSDASKLMNNGEYLEFSNKETSRNQFQASPSALTFTYLYDTYTYTAKNNIFNSIFRNKDSAKSVQSGFFLLGYSKFFHRGTFDFYWKTGGGLSYNAGLGKFSDDGSLSRTTFKLWNIPLELTLGVKLNVGRFLGLNLNGGGVIVGTYQSRSDRKAGEEGKEVRQILYGYTGEAALELTLSQMMPNFAQYLKSNSDVGDFSLALTAKVIEASNSKSDEYQISGASFGLGFKFELL